MKEKSAFPVLDLVRDVDGNDRYCVTDGISQDYYVAVRIFPEMIKLVESKNEDRLFSEIFSKAADLTWLAVDALNKAKEERDATTRRQ